jgi:predicted PurR-regulated permease PerM
MNLGRFRHGKPDVEGGDGDAAAAEIDPSELSGIFAAPGWLRDLGIMAWLVVGAILVLVGIVWLLGLTATIVNPVVTGGIIATVSSPVVAWLRRHSLPRAAGAAIVLIGLIAIAAVVLILVLYGIHSQSDEIRSNLSKGVDKIQSWLEDLGVGSSTAKETTGDATGATNSAGLALLKGVIEGIRKLTSLAFFLSFTAFSTFFLLKDGPTIKSWVDRHLGLPLSVARVITGRTLQSLRRYFLGVTIVATFNGIVVGLGGLALGVPLWGTIGLVVFITAYVPFIGAFVSGAFAVLLTLGSQGSRDAVIMLIIVILANGALQNIVSPIAMGATLRLNPLAILIVTISAGAIFGMVGLVLAGPLTSAAVQVTGDLRRARAVGEATAGG